jgi:hypothetical protein
MGNQQLVRKKTKPKTKTKKQKTKTKPNILGAPSCTDGTSGPMSSSAMTRASISLSSMRLVSSASEAVSYSRVWSSMIVSCSICSSSAKSLGSAPPPLPAAPALVDDAGGSPARPRDDLRVGDSGLHRKGQARVSYISFQLCGKQSRRFFFFFFFFFFGAKKYMKIINVTLPGRRCRRRRGGGGRRRRCCRCRRRRRRR